ncbi:MAG: amidohydrolase family protein [Algoriphagus sp.]|jgi:imidazolonepropionase-like amidohydrolase|uniref:amidohydrolase family protein n=1 Tax=Algoriphagus sp. TaxID=1872435 RepID=UPI0026162023|nr:amidohydrolase family protein [Algoriphagus sp.]MDG1277848.1 amidohydrolase family protein [Algoriphagus sp.]
MQRPSFLPLLGILILAACSPSPSSESKITVLQGAKLFDGTGNSISNSVIILQDGKISAIGGPEIEIPENVNLMDVTGKFIAPGLVDAHVHFSQTGFFDGRPDALDIRDTLRFDSLQARLKRDPQPYLESYLRSGVTAVYDVGGFEWTVHLAKSAESNLNAPHVAAAGPLLTPFDQDRLDIFNVPPARQMLALTSPEFGKEYVQKSTAMGSTGIKIWSFNLKDSLFMQSLRAVAEEVKTQGNQLIVHATNLDEAKEAIRLGAKVLVHSVDDQVVDEEFIQMAKESGVIVCPTLVVVPGYSIAFKSLRGEYPLNDPNQVVDSETRNLLKDSQAFFKYYNGSEKFEEMVKKTEEVDDQLKTNMYANLKLLYEAGIPIALSTDAGNPGTLHGLSIYDELEAMQAAGIPAKDLIPMATQNGAKTMRRLDDFGTLEVGKMADLIILDKDPH